jgi:uncharacterized membrane protein
MSWSTRFRLRQYLTGSLWFVPLVGGVLGWLAGATGPLAGESVDLRASWEYSPSTASTVLTTIVGATAALTGFVVTVSVLVVQMATGTFSARYMRLWYRDRVLKAVLAVLVGTLALSFTLLRRVETDSVPNLGVTVSGTLLVVGLLLFLLFLDRFVHRLRPVAVAALVARHGRRQLLAAAAAAPDGDLPPPVLDSERVLAVRAHTAGAIQAIDARGLVRWAEQHDCVLVFRHSVGDFVPTGATVLDVFGRLDDAAREGPRLREMFALGIERTIEQDPAFAVRILVDIAIKALSPAVNDPTTAVQALNHLGDTLHLIATVDLAEKVDLRDEQGRVRVVVPARRWEDYLALGVTEIREYGATAIQVVRRLRALLEELLEDVRPAYRAAVEDELARLDATVAEQYGSSVDLDRALTPDRQGIGGPASTVHPAGVMAPTGPTRRMSGQ